jgi:hypothetical protein
MRTAAETNRAALIQKILPERLRTMGTGGGGPGGGGRGGGGSEDGPPAPTVLAVLRALAAAQDAAHDGAQRGLYHNGTDAHNCTTHEKR